MNLMTATPTEIVDLNKSALMQGFVAGVFVATATYMGSKLLLKIGELKKSRTTEKTDT